MVEMEMQCSIGCADWIMTCEVLCWYSRLILQPDAPFTAAHKHKEQGAAPTYLLD